MTKYKYCYIIQLQMTETRWKDICKMDCNATTSAEVERKLAAIRERNKNSVYRIIRRRKSNERAI